MSTLGWIAINGFRESVRDKVLYSIVAFALVMIGASYLIGQLTAGQDVKIMKDLGLSSISIFGLFMATFIGIGLVSKEVERRSIYGLLAKPVRRHEIDDGRAAVETVGIRRDAEADQLLELRLPLRSLFKFVRHRAFFGFRPERRSRTTPIRRCQTCAPARSLRSG